MIMMYFLIGFLHQKNSITAVNTTAFPSVNNNKQRSLATLDIPMVAADEGPLREIIFLFRNTTRLNPPKCCCTSTS